MWEVFPPTYVAAYDQVDIGAQFTVTDNLNLFVDAINITDETVYVYGRTDDQPLYCWSIRTAI